MKINTKATNLSISPAVSEYIEKKISSLNKFIDDKDISVNVEVAKTTNHHKSGDIYRAEIAFKANGEDFYIEVQTDDIYTSIDKLKDEVAHTLSSRKKRALRSLRRGGAIIKNVLKGFLDVGKRFRRK